MFYLCLVVPCLPRRGRRWSGACPCIQPYPPHPLLGRSESADVWPAAGGERPDVHRWRWACRTRTWLLAGWRALRRRPLSRAAAHGHHHRRVTGAAAVIVIIISIAADSTATSGLPACSSGSSPCPPMRRCRAAGEQLGAVSTRRRCRAAVEQLDAISTSATVSPDFWRAARHPLYLSNHVVEAARCSPAPCPPTPTRRCRRAYGHIYMALARSPPPWRCPRVAGVQLGTRASGPPAIRPPSPS